MNKFVKGAKNLALALSFVSVCACNRGGENTDLNAVNKEFGPRGKDNVNGNKQIIFKKVDEGVTSGSVNNGVSGNVNNSDVKVLKQCVVKSRIEKNKINFDLLRKFGVDLSGCNFVVSKDNKILFDEKEIFDFSNFSAEFVSLLKIIIEINNYRGVLEFEKGFKRIKIGIDDNMFTLNGVEFDDVERCINFICILGVISGEVFNKLFDCEKFGISNGKINSKIFNMFWKKFRDSNICLNVDGVVRGVMFLKGFSLLCGGKECKFVKCDSAGGFINSLNKVGIEVDGVGVVVIS